MQQLSGIDASFLAMETATTFTHVSSLSVFDPGEASGTDWFEAAKRTIAARLDRAPLFRRRLVEVPFGLDLPYWVDDPAFDLDFHVRHHAVPPPGDDRQLADTVARIVGRPLDRSRPLWELYVIEGLSGGRMAWLTKVHHATIDGASGAELLATLLDTDPHTRPPETAVVPPADGELPDDAMLLRRTAAEYLRRPEKMVRLTVRTLRELAQRTGSGSVAALADLAAQPVPGPVGDLVRRRLRASRGVDVDRPPALPPTMAPRTPFNATVTAHRRFAFTTVALDDAKRIRRAFGCTLNDVVLAACSGTLRRWLAEHDALPDEPLVAMCPVSIRTGAETDAFSNRVSGVLCSLATDLDDPAARLAAIRASMGAAKEMHAAIPAEQLLDFSQFVAPALAVRAMRMYQRTRIADRFRPPFNLIISNVPGPTFPLWASGARLEHYYPVSAVIDGQGLNITVQSYDGRLDVGFVACRELVPDLWTMVDHLHASFDELAAAAPAAGGELPSPAGHPGAR